MHPAMYEDPFSRGHQGTMKLRCSERLFVSNKPRCPCCDSHSRYRNKLHGSVMTSSLTEPCTLIP